MLAGRGPPGAGPVPSGSGQTGGTITPREPSIVVLLRAHGVSRAIPSGAAPRGFRQPDLGAMVPPDMVVASAGAPPGAVWIASTAFV
jgi:hypothetical protein